MAINKQVAAFDESVGDAFGSDLSRNDVADQRRIENVKTLFAMSDFFAGILAQWLEAGREHIDSSSPAFWIELEDVCRTLLGAMMRLSNSSRANSLEAPAAFDKAILTVRETLALSRDAQKPGAARAAADLKISEVDREEFGAEAKKNPPPQSWFDENTDRLRGLRR